ncbi:hypothetical protein [Vibrio barjaei]|uniref:hypothetical protein n=1 Tax=Vibrio barjaei TaxID=1676683 RepID=UPI002284BE3E|nr:hypothetical protein [Vibrio barjaei]MCY9870114.1 hypothetical protein [Vibrio barjaei]
MKLLHLQLFWHQTQNTLLEMEDLPVLTEQQQQDFKLWMKKRRKILSFEVHQQSWVKVNQDGFSSLIELRPNGSLVERDMFGGRSLSGLWKVIDGLLFIKVISGEFIVEYQIAGSSEQNIHDGVEYINGKVSTYSKFVQVKA